MIIKVDVDGVLRNLNEAMCSLYNTLYEEYVTVGDIFDYDVDKVFTKINENEGMSAVDFFFKNNAEAMLLYSKPYDGVIDALNRLKELGHKIVIVTWQFTTLNKLLTLKFLETNKIPYDGICFTKDKWMIDGDWIIDDNPEFLLNKLEKSRKIIIDMPYNKNVEFDGIRARNLVDAVKLIEIENE